MKKTLRQDLEKLKTNRTFLIVLILLFVCAIFWTSLSLFSSQNDTKISTEQKKLAQPLNPNLDLRTISQLETKKYFSDVELSNFQIFKLITDGASASRVVPIEVNVEDFNFETGQENVPQSNSLLENEL